MSTDAPGAAEHRRERCDRLNRELSALALCGLATPAGIVQEVDRHRRRHERCPEVAHGRALTEELLRAG